MRPTCTATRSLAEDTGALARLEVAGRRQLSDRGPGRLALERPEAELGLVLLTGKGSVPDESFDLKAGDVVTMDIEGVGSLTNPVVQLGRDLSR